MSCGSPTTQEATAFYLSSARQLDLGLLSAFSQTLQRQSVLVQVRALLLLELVDHVVDQDVIKVLASQPGVTVGGLDLEHAVIDIKNGHIKSAAAQIVHRDDLAVLLGSELLVAVRERSRGGLVDDALHLQTGDLPSILGRRALQPRGISVGGNANEATKQH